MARRDRATMSVVGFFSPPGPGQGLARATWLATALTTVLAFAALPDTVVRVAYVVVSLVLFAAGCVAFVVAFLVAVERSRTEEVSVVGLWFMADKSAPGRVRASFMLAVVVQTAVVVTAASLRPFTSLAFGILVPMFGLGAAGLWAARHGSFAKRTELRYKRPKHPGKSHG